MICGDFNFEPEVLEDGAWHRNNNAQSMRMGTPTCHGRQSRELDWCLCSTLFAQLRAPSEHPASIISPHTLVELTIIFALTDRPCGLKRRKHPLLPGRGLLSNNKEKLLAGLGV
eukprot:1793315-Amphidinium_carterae.3